MGAFGQEWVTKEIRKLLTLHLSQKGGRGMAIVAYFFGSAVSLAGQECHSGNNLGRLVKRVVKAGRHSLVYISILKKMSGK